MLSPTPTPIPSGLGGLMKYAPLCEAIVSFKIGYHKSLSKYVETSVFSLEDVFNSSKHISISTMRPKFNYKYLADSILQCIVFLGKVSYFDSNVTEACSWTSSAQYVINDSGSGLAPDEWTDRWTNGQTEKVKQIYSPSIFMLCSYVQ